MSQFKAGDIEGTLKQLSQEEQDILLKFIYKGFREPTDSSCGSLLSWHEKVRALRFCQCKIDSAF